MSAVQVNPKDPLRTKGAQKIGMAVRLRDDHPPLLDVSDAPSRGNWPVKQIDAPLHGDSRHLDKSTGGASEPMAGTTGEKIRRGDHSGTSCLPGGDFAYLSGGSKSGCLQTSRWRMQ